MRPLLIALALAGCAPEVTSEDTSKLQTQIDEGNGGAIAGKVARGARKAVGTPHASARFKAH